MTTANETTDPSLQSLHQWFSNLLQSRRSPPDFPSWHFTVSFFSWSGKSILATINFYWDPKKQKWKRALRVWRNENVRNRRCVKWVTWCQCKKDTNMCNSQERASCLLFEIDHDENICLWAQQKPLPHSSWYFQLHIKGFRRALYTRKNLSAVWLS
jgi:hypothetical protein